VYLVEWGPSCQFGVCARLAKGELCFVHFPRIRYMVPSSQNILLLVWYIWIVVMSPAYQQLSWPFTLPAGWCTTLSLGCESVSGWAVSWKLDMVWGTNTLATKILRPVTTWLFLEFCQRCLHTTIATVLGKAMRLNLRCDCLSWCYNAVAQYHLDICHVTHGVHVEYL
jgi:hypothetical protein